jgi:hypothetical protein
LFILNKIIFMFLYRFDVLILKIIFLKNIYIILIHFQIKKYIKKIITTKFLNCLRAGAYITDRERCKTAC